MTVVTFITFTRIGDIKSFTVSKGIEASGPLSSSNTMTCKSTFIMLIEIFDVFIRKDEIPKIK